jgi:hypothetical protein
MPFDGAEHILPHLQSRAPLPLVEFVGHLFRQFPDLRAEVDGPGPTGGWWIELKLEDLSPGIEWREATGFALYGPGPTLPERPNARVAGAQEAAQRLERMLRSWSTGRTAEQAAA